MAEALGRLGARVPEEPVMQLDVHDLRKDLRERVDALRRHL
jgi:hypothetical protein